MKVSEKFIESYAKIMFALAIVFGFCVVLFVLEFQVFELNLYNFLVFGLGYSMGGIFFLGMFYKRFLSQHWEFEK